MSKLSPKQERFVQEYCLDQNATQAALRAHYSKKNPGVMGSRLYNDPKIRAAIDAELKAMGEKVEIKAADLLRELLLIAKLDIRQAFTNNGSLQPTQTMPEEIARAVSGIDVDELFEGAGRDRRHVGFTKKVRFWDKLRAIECLLKIEGSLRDRHELTGKDGHPLAPAMPLIDFSKWDKQDILRVAGMRNGNGDSH